MRGYSHHKGLGDFVTSNIQSALACDHKEQFVEGCRPYLLTGKSQFPDLEHGGGLFVRRTSGHRVEGDCVVE